MKVLSDRTIVVPEQLTPTLLTPDTTDEFPVKMLLEMVIKEAPEMATSVEFVVTVQF